MYGGFFSRRGGVRAAYCRLALAAADAGMEDPAALLEKTPLAASLAVRALAARRAQALAQNDRLAWMVGYYVALGVHTPARYPPEPCLAPCQPMTDDEMKRALLAMAARGKETPHDAGNAAN